MRQRIHSQNPTQIDTRKPLNQATATAVFKELANNLAHARIQPNPLAEALVGRSAQLPLPYDAESLEEAIREDFMGEVRQAVSRMAQELVEREVTRLVGEKYQRKDAANPHRRHGTIASRITLDGQPFEFKRQRVRDTQAGCEVELAGLKAFQRRDAMSQAVKTKLIRGISTRNYDATTSELAAGLGLKKSAVSAAFKVAAQKDLDALNSRRLDSQTFVALLLDGVGFADVLVLVAVGITSDGRKVILGLREGSSENHVLVKDLLNELLERGLKLTAKTLFVLDGAKALHKGVREVFGDRAVIQRCIEHKIRNVQSYLPLEWKTDVRRRLRAAWGLTSYDEARRALLNVHRWLSEHSVSAAASLLEGFEETLTLHRLNVPPVLRLSLATTNSIESIFSQVQHVCRNVKRWRNPHMVLRWAGTALTHVEPTLRIIKGYRSLSVLVAALQADSDSSKSLLSVSDSVDSCAPCQTAVA